MAFRAHWIWVIVAAVFMSGRASYAAEVCPAPKFAIAPFKTADDGIDRGFIAGVSLIDTDGDGDLDVYLTRGYSTLAQSMAELKVDRSMLYLNDGKGRFTRDLDSALSNTLRVASGSTWADVFHTGRPDVFVGTELGAKDLFYRNLGSNHFYIDSLGDATETKGSSFSATFGDIDGDGDLDLVAAGGGLEPAQKNKVYKNDNGKFVRMTNSPLENGVSSTMSVLFADVDNDGLQDFIASSHDLVRKSGHEPAAEIETTMLYRNRGNWDFEPMKNEPFSAPGRAGDVAALGDVDNDGDLDLYISPAVYDKSPMPERGLLYLNDGHGAFSENPRFLGVAHNDIAAGAAFADFNGDGNLDLMVAEYNTGIHLYLGDGSGDLSEAVEPELNARVSGHSSIAAGDLDGDGRPDAIIANWGEKPEGDYALLLQNKAVNCGAWTEFVLKDRFGASNPPHARVTLVTRGKAGRLRRQLRESSAQTSFRAQGGSFFLFGVPADEKILQAEIRWPDGSTRIVRNPTPGKRNLIAQPKSR